MQALYVPAGVVGGLLVGWVGWWLFRYVRASKDRRKAMRLALRIRWSWVRLSQMLGLTVNDPTPWFPRLHRLIKRKAYRFPIAKSRVRMLRLRIQTDEYGVRIRVRTRPGIGLEEIRNQAPHLSNAWRTVRVTATQDRPGVVHVRAVDRDPLTEMTEWHPTGEDVSDEAFHRWQIGRDEYAEDSALRLKNVPGMAVAGLPGSGKTSLIGGQLLSRYAPSRRFACILCDGKGGDDYEDWYPRAAAHVGDDLDEALTLWERLSQLRVDRQKALRLPPELGGLGTKNFWNVGPTDQWPWVAIVIDESQHYLREYRGNDPVTKDKAAKTAAIRGHVEDMVKKGRSAGMFTLLATQKASADAFGGTAIRDVLPILASYAQTTDAAAVCALGDDIREYPEASPVELQGEEYVGVMTVKTIGQRGFTRVRTPFVPESEQAAIAAATADLRVDPWALVPSGLTVPRLSVVRDETQAEAI